MSIYSMWQRRLGGMSIMRIQDFSSGRRRVLVATGSAAALVMLGVPPGFALVAGASVPAQANEQFDVKEFNIRYVVTDRRYQESLAFGQLCRSAGGMPLEVTDGLTKLWREVLKPLWSEHGGAVAGLTTREVWHCLAEQARSQSHRTVKLRRNDVAANQFDPLVSWIIA